jgi:hypothetical protein
MRLRLFLSAVFALLAFAPAAHADTMCVSLNPVGPECDGGGFVTIQSALLAADSNLEADTVRIDSSRDWEEDGLITGTSGFPLTIESSTNERVFIGRATNPDGADVLQTGSGTDVTIKRVYFSVPGETESNYGIEAQGQLKLEDVSVAVPSDAVSSTGIRLSGAGNHDFSRVYVLGGAFGISQGSGSLNMERSIVFGATDSFGLITGGVGQSPSATIHQSTFYGDGNGTGLTVSNAVGTGASLELRDVVSANNTLDLKRQGGASDSFPADLFSDWGAIDPAKYINDGPGNSVIANPMNDAPQFYLPDLAEGMPRPLRGGNLVDVDFNAALRTGFGEDDIVDFEGNPRLVGKRDLGAIEVQPLPGNLPGPPAFTVVSIGSLKFTPKKIKRKKKGKVSYALSAPANVTFTATPQKKGKKKPKVVKLGSQAGKAGSNTFTFKTNKLKPGKYIFAATPAGGNAKTASLTIKK